MHKFVKCILYIGCIVLTIAFFAAFFTTFFGDHSDRYESYIEVIHTIMPKNEDEPVYYQVFLNITCSWEAMSFREQVDLAKFCVEKCRTMATEIGISNYKVEGFSIMGSLAFTETEIYGWKGLFDGNY